MGDKAYVFIKRFFSEHRNRSTFIKSSDGKIIVNEVEKLRTWKEYIEKLYGNKQTRQNQTIHGDERRYVIQYGIIYTKRRI